MRYNAYCLVVTWEVVLHAEVEAWLGALSEDERERVLTALLKLAEHGPSLGRPLVDHVKGSTLMNLKELRPLGTSLRCLFIFDPSRRAQVLVAGDKRGKWSSWYAKSIPIAQQRYQIHPNRFKGEPHV